MKIGVVLLSGGLDSATTAAIALDRGYTLRAINFAYGQRHFTHEAQAAERVAAHFGIALETVRFQHPAAAAGGVSSLTNHDLDMPEGRSLDEMKKTGGVPNTYVPLRNTIFLAHAAAALESWALSICGKTQDGQAQAQRVERASLFIGAHADDYEGYPDCRAEYLALMAQAINEGSSLPQRITIEAPLVRCDKVEIVLRADALGVPIAQTRSCYADLPEPCGVCDTCAIRDAAIKEAGVAV